MEGCDGTAVQAEEVKGLKENLAMGLERKRRMLATERGQKQQGLKAECGVRLGGDWGLLMTDTILFVGGDGKGKRRKFGNEDGGKQDAG